MIIYRTVNSSVTMYEYGNENWKYIIGKDVGKRKSGMECLTLKFNSFHLRATSIPDGWTLASGVYIIHLFCSLLSVQLQLDVTQVRIWRISRARSGLLIFSLQTLYFIKWLWIKIQIVLRFKIWHKLFDIFIHWVFG